VTAGNETAIKEFSFVNERFEATLFALQGNIDLIQ
jgi:hypothetical protein